MQVVLKDENAYTIDCSLFLRSVTVEDAGKYKVTARNDLGESNATISLNFDSEFYPLKYLPNIIERSLTKINCEVQQNSAQAATAEFFISFPTQFPPFLVNYFILPSGRSLTSTLEAIKDLQ